jgi:outer membrane protein assembly factor BamB/YHS domain-containing protein
MTGWNALLRRGFMAGLLCGLAVAGCGGRPPALRGYDPVLLIEGKQVEGDARLEATHGRFLYRFSSAATEAAFRGDPDRYAIQLDGRCARLQGDVEGAPNIFTVHDGRIYIFSNSRNLRAFESDPDGYVGDHFVAAEGVPAEAAQPAQAPDGAATSAVAADAAPSPTGASAAAPPAAPPPEASPGAAAHTAAAPAVGPMDDWPQWGGPRRDFTVLTSGLAPDWPEGGPKRLWKRPLGDGFSAIAMRDGRLFTMYRRGDEEVAVAIDAPTGRTLWEHSYPAPFDDRYQMRHGPGPHATPLVVDGTVFTVGATAMLHALDRETGRPLWSRDLVMDFGAKVPVRGYASSPLAHGDTLILMVGGEGHALVALDRQEGKVVWHRHDFATSLSSPIRIEVGGQEQIVAFMADVIVGVEPSNGDLVWSHPHVTDWGLNISTPVWGDDGLLFISSAYEGGSRVLRLTRDGGRTVPHEVWANRRLRVHFGNAIRIGDRIYGSSGDSGPAFFAAVDAQTGDIAWRQRGFSKASFLLADGHFIILDEDGVLALATPTPEGLQVHSQVELLDHVAWTVPTLVGTTLYVRDRKNIMALDLGGSAQAGSTP